MSDKRLHFFTIVKRVRHDTNQLASHIYIYIYIVDNIFDHGTFFASFMERWVAGLSTLLQASTYLACPAHCHPSVLAPFLFGVATGICLVIPCLFFIGFALVWHFPALRTWISQPPPTRPAPRSSSRLQGYLHEH